MRILNRSRRGQTMMEAMAVLLFMVIACLAAAKLVGDKSDGLFREAVSKVPSASSLGL